ncbi:MAG: hypothetical protein FDZ70_00425 [Actinobacteria bacterium]|nr:MAG: hypothetical protein FDZ70_00425 [Actinomycetota bacterium]
MSIRRLVTLLTVAALAASTVGCTPKRAGRTLTGSDSGSVIEVGVGDRFTVALAENPTTGYLWAVSGALPSIVETASDDYDSESAPGLVGGGGTRTIVYRAVSAGSGDVGLVYVRPWETTGTPAATFTVTVRAR